MKAPMLHCCAVDRDCRAEGAPARLYVHTRWGSLIIGARSQLWLPGAGYTSLWFPVVWHPKTRGGR